MAQPIPLQVPPRDPARELRARLDRIPKNTGKQSWSLTTYSRSCTTEAFLEIVLGALAASDDILERVVDNAKTPEAVRAIRNLIFWRQILGSIEPDWFKGIFQAIPEGIAQATTDRDKPVNIFGLLGDSSAKTVFALWLQESISCRPWTSPAFTGVELCREERTVGRSIETWEP